MSGPEERQRAVDLYFTTPMTMSQVVEHLGHPTRQRPACRLAADPRHAGETHHPTGDKNKGDRTDAGRHTRKQDARTARREHRSRPQPGQDIPRRRRPRRGVEEPEPGKRVDAGGGGGVHSLQGQIRTRRVRAMLKTRVPEKTIRRIMAEDTLVTHAPKRRRYSSHEGETTPAHGNLADRDFTTEAPNGKCLRTSPRSRPGTGRRAPPR